MSLASPFQEPTDQTKRTSLWNRVTKPSEFSTKERDEVIGIARSMLDWSGMPYHARFAKYLTTERDKPVAMEDQFKMIAGTARANTFKEILAHLEHEAQRAAVAVGEDNG